MTPPAPVVYGWTTPAQLRPLTPALYGEHAGDYIGVWSDPDSSRTARVAVVPCPVDAVVVVMTREDAEARLHDLSHTTRHNPDDGCLDCREAAALRLALAPEPK